MLCRNGAAGRTASIKKCAVIVSGVRRQPNGVERSPVCHGLRWPEEIFYHGPPDFAGMERKVDMITSKNRWSPGAEHAAIRTESNDPPSVTHSDGLKKFSTTVPMLCRNGATGRIA